MKTLFQLEEDPATDSRHLTQIVIRALTFRAAKMPSGILAKLRALDKKLTGDSFWGQFARYVLNATEDEDYNVKGNTVQFRRQPSQRVRKLAAQVAANPDLFSAHLPQFIRTDGHHLYEFGAKLTDGLYSQETVDAVISAQLSALPEMKTQFISGYFAGLKARAPDLWEASVCRLLDDKRSREIGITVVRVAGISESIVRALLRLFLQGHGPAEAFSRLAWQAEHDNIPHGLVEEVFVALVNSADEESLRMAIQLAHLYFFDMKKPRSCDEALVFRLLSADQFFRREEGTLKVHYWLSVAQGFRERFPGRDLELLGAILSYPEHLWRTRVSRGPGSLAEAIVRTHPDEAWSMVNQLLESEEAHSIVSWLGDEFGLEAQTGAIKHFDPDTVMMWVLQNSATRAKKLLRCLPKTLDEQDGGRLTRLYLEAFGDNEEVTDILIAYFLLGSFRGPESAHRAGQRAKARQWVSENTAGKVRAWLHRFIAVLNRDIEEAELREERGF